jgi:hypothetical protein
MVGDAVEGDLERQDDGEHHERVDAELTLRQTDPLHGSILICHVESRLNGVSLSRATRGH